MTCWELIAKHGNAVMPIAEWTALLGVDFSVWEQHLSRIDDPTGRRFLGNLGDATAEYEIINMVDGFGALDVETGDVTELNPTEAEFRTLNLDGVLNEIARAGRWDGGVTGFDRPPRTFCLGLRELGGKRIVAHVVLRPTVLTSPGMRAVLSPAASRADVSVLLVPPTTHVSPTDRLDLLAAQMTVVDLPARAPWRCELSVLVDEPQLGIVVSELPEVFYPRYLLMVDQRQQRVWLADVDLGLRADSHSYRLMAYLAERAGRAVPCTEVANQGLEPTGLGLRDETKIIRDAKAYLKKQLSRLAAAEWPEKVPTADDLIVIANGTVRLGVEPARVKVISG